MLFYPVFRSPQTGSVYTKVTPGNEIFAAARYVPGDQSCDGASREFRVRIQVASERSGLLELALKKLSGKEYGGRQWGIRSSIHMSIVVPLAKVHRAVADAAEVVMEIIETEGLTVEELPTVTLPELLPVMGGPIAVSNGQVAAPPADNAAVIAQLQRVIAQLG
jgi:hypothetical protein